MFNGINNLNIGLRLNGVQYNEELSDSIFMHAPTKNDNEVMQHMTSYYSAYTPVVIDVDKMLGLGFSMPEINMLQEIANCGRRVGMALLLNYGIPYEQAERLKYMYDISTGKVVIETKDDFAKHLRRMFGKHRRIGISNLMLSKVHKVPRKAVIAGIKDKTFSIYNSKLYSKDKRMYDVIGVSSSRIYIETSRKPILKYGQSKEIEGVIEIKELKSNGNVVISVDKKYAKLVNRFIIVASLKKPEFHHGMYEILCIEGTKVYVFGQTLGTHETVRYNGGTQRVYDYGFYPSEIKPKLTKVAQELYAHVHGVYVTEYPSNSDFNIIDFEDGTNEVVDMIEE